MLSFGQKEVTTEFSYGQRQITDIFTIDINKLVVSDKMSCNNGEDCRYIVSYQVDEGLIPLFIKTPKNIFSYGVSQYKKTSAYTTSFNVSEEKAYVAQYEKIWNETESQLFEKLATEPMKGEGKYVHGKLKTWKERIKTNFHGQVVPHDMYCNAMAVLKIDSVYKQGKNYLLLVYVEECKYTDAENQQCNMPSDDDDGFFEVLKEGQKDFCNLYGVTKLIINEQDVAVELAKKLNIPRRNCIKTKEEPEEAIEDNIAGYKNITFGSDTPACMACLDEL